MIEERFDPDRTILTLSFAAKQAKKASEEKVRRKTWDNMRKIEKYLACHEAGKTNDIADHLQLDKGDPR